MLSGFSLSCVQNTATNFLKTSTPISSTIPHRAFSSLSHFCQKKVPSLSLPHYYSATPWLIPLLQPPSHHLRPLLAPPAWIALQVPMAPLICLQCLLQHYRLLSYRRTTRMFHSKCPPLLHPAAKSHELLPSRTSEHCTSVAWTRESPKMYSDRSSRPLVMCNP